MASVAVPTTADSVAAPAIRPAAVPVERQDERGAQHQCEHHDHFDQAKQPEPQALGIDVGIEELRAARVAEREDEQHASAKPMRIACLALGGRGRTLF
jgi:hypothetical protein